MKAIAHGNAGVTAGASLPGANSTGEGDSLGTIRQREGRGRALRKQTPRSSHAAWSPPTDRPDPIALLEEQGKTRLPDLLPERYGRMRTSAFAFMRGAAIVMASDLAHTPNSGIDVQLCGDSHLANFGAYVSPEGVALFDISDFDETLRGPWEWDVKRLAASFVVAGRDNTFSPRQCRAAARAATASYRNHMRKYAKMADLDLWYAQVHAGGVLDLLTGEEAKQSARASIRQGRKMPDFQDHVEAHSKLVEVVDGKRRIVEKPPLLTHLSDPAVEAQIRENLHAYKEGLSADRRYLLDQYRVLDVALKVVGVGSVGTRVFLALCESRDGEDPLFLQIKEADASALQVALPASPRTGAYPNQGERVVTGQRWMQGHADIFLGWFGGADGRDYYVRHFHNVIAAAEAESMSARMLAAYAGYCGWALARAHARSGDRIAIAAYLGRSDRFDEAIVSFAERYADQTARDFTALRNAIDAGRLPATRPAS